jgi:hypothetical protein
MYIVSGSMGWLMSENERTLQSVSVDKGILHFDEGRVIERLSLQNAANGRYRKYDDSIMFAMQEVF